MTGDFMEDQTTNIQPQPQSKSQEAQIKDFGHDVLLPVLYFAYDAFLQVGMQFFLVKQTAKDAIAHKQLSGDCVTIGIRRTVWQSGDDFLLRAYLENYNIPIIHDKYDALVFMYQNVPVHIYFYDNNLCTTALVPLTYEHEIWMIPNRFDLFEKEYDHD